MERSKYIFCFLLMFSFIYPVSNMYARERYKEMIYESYLTGDMEKWKEVIAALEKDSSETIEEKQDLLNYYYGYVGYLIDARDTKSVKLYLKKGEELIRQVLEENPQHARGYAYKGVFLAYRMNLNKIATPILGPQSMKYINKAYDLDPEDIQVIIDKANLLYYSPKFVGGNRKDALSLYQKGIRLMEEQEKHRTNWFYLSQLTSLAQRYEENGDYETSVALYEKILEIAPSFKWVKEELYPSLLLKMN